MDILFFFLIINLWIFLFLHVVKWALNCDCNFSFFSSLMTYYAICRTSTLPALFIFGKASIDVDTCVECLSHCLTTSNKPIMVRMDNLLWLLLLVWLFTHGKLWCRCWETAKSLFVIFSSYGFFFYGKLSWEVFFFFFWQWKII